MADDERLPKGARRAIADARNEVLVSAVSGWEIAINAQLGRVALPEPPDRFVPQQLRANAFETLPVSMSHALAVSRLPDLRRDAFDRILIAQAIIERVALVTADEHIARYPQVRLVW